jgi:hypothetical protein
MRHCLQVHVEYLMREVVEEIVVAGEVEVGDEVASNPDDGVGVPAVKDAGYPLQFRWLLEVQDVLYAVYQLGQDFDLSAVRHDVRLLPGDLEREEEAARPLLFLDQPIQSL